MARADRCGFSETSGPGVLGWISPLSILASALSHELGVLGSWDWPPVGHHAQRVCFYTPCHPMVTCSQISKMLKTKKNPKWSVKLQKMMGFFGSETRDVLSCVYVSTKGKDLRK